VYTSYQELLDQVWIVYWSYVTSMALWQGAITTLEDNAFFGMKKLSYLDMMQNHVTPATYIFNISKY
jgi:hypothetical protein